MSQFAFEQDSQGDSYVLKGSRVNTLKRSWDFTRLLNVPSLILLMPSLFKFAAELKVCLFNFSQAPGNVNK